jgi:hypothetical protein
VKAFFVYQRRAYEDGITSGKIQTETLASFDCRSSAFSEKGLIVELAK